MPLVDTINRIKKSVGRRASELSRMLSIRVLEGDLPS